MNSLKAAAREYGRISSLLLLSFLIVIFLGVNPACANGVRGTIGNGETVYGTVTAPGYPTNYDVYSFSVPAGAYVFAEVSEVGTHDPTYTPYVEIDKPNGTLGSSDSSSLYAGTDVFNATGGTWTVYTWRNSGTTGGTYAMQIVVVPGASGVSGGNAGGSMYPGATYSGSISGNPLDIYTFNAIAGQNFTATVTDTGGTSYVAWMQLLKPDGTNVALVTTSTNASHTATAVAGTYTILVGRDEWANPNTGTYTVGVTGAGVDMPGNAKTDGYCEACHQRALAAASGNVTADGRAAVGAPINVATGNMYEQVTDYTTVGTNPLALTRTYNSMSYTRNLYPTLMGANWRTNYDRYLRDVSSTQATVERPDGRAINFNLISSVWTPDTDVDVKLTKSGSTWTLTDSDDTAEVYTESSGKGTLNSITLPNGYTQTMNYTSGVLTSVSDSYSRSLSFTYTSGVLTGVTTPDSATLTYGYTTKASQSLLTSVSYNTSPTTSQTYVYANSGYPFALTSIVDENGNTNSQWTYDGAGRCTMSEHAGGADEVQVSYDDSTGNRTVTNPLGETETYKFTTYQSVPKVTEIDRAASSPVAAATRTFTYDANGYLATAKDWDGNITHWTNNSHGLPTSITEAYGAGIARTTTISYDSTWVHKPYTTTKTNVTIDDRYDSTQGTLLTHELTDTTGGSTNGQTRTWTYTYDATGELLTAQTPRTDVTVKTTYTYTSGALASITDPLSNVTTINTVNGTGQPTKITDANSVETDFAYDARNHLTSKTVKAGTNEVTSYSYYADEKLDVVTLPDSGSDTITYTYDNAHRVTKITNGASETMNYTLDAMGDVTAWNFKNSSSTTEKSGSATFDVLGDKLTSVGSAGATQTTNFTYDGNKNRLSVKDPNSQTTSLAWDALNRPSTVTDPYSHTAAPTYDNLDNITAQTDFDGYSTSFTFDGFHDAISKTSPDTGTATFTFDGDHNVTKRVDARSVETDRTFDKLERPTAETYPSYSSEAIAYTYDATAGGNVGIGRLTSLTDESGSTTFVYDNFGNVLSSVRVIGTQTYTTSYSYDLANRVTQIVYPSGRIVNYTYSTSGYLTQVDTKPSSGGTDTVLASSITHQPFGPIASLSYGNTLSQTNTWDDNYWLDDIVTSNGSTHIQNLTYAQDYAGNLTSITDNLAAGRDEIYTVDDLNRLHTASGAYGSRTYTYDSNGNRSTWYNGTITRTSTLTTSTNLLASITDGTNTRHFTNSASGNVLTDDRAMNGAVAISNTYGGRDRLESMTVGTPTITFKINALGQRVQKATTSATTDYLYDLAGHLIGEANDSTGSTTLEYIFMEGNLLAQVDSSGNIYYSHDNQVGAPQKLTNSSMTIVWDYETEPFGETYATPTNTDPTNHRFPGQYADAEDLLSYNMNRDYDTTLGRYIEHDPLGFGGGYNLFSYTGQNPTQAVDPLGLRSDLEQPAYGADDDTGAGYTYLPLELANNVLLPALALGDQAVVEVISSIRNMLGITPSLPNSLPCQYVTWLPDNATIGDILSGYDPDTMIHLTPDPESDFTDGVDPGTFFARLGDVSGMTVSGYQADVVAGGAAAGPSQSVSGFVIANPGSGTFTPAAISNNSNTQEYMNTQTFSHDGYVPVPK